MARRCLFGPVTAAFAEQNLHRARQSGECLAFNALGDVDVTIGHADDWATVCSRLPADWQPDFIALYLPYTTIPAALWSAPVPVVGLAADWNLLWHYYRRRLPSCELILTDTAGVEAFHKEGMAQARIANLYGLERDYLERMPTAVSRDIDILFAGNLHAAVQRDRLAWLGRLAGLAGRWRVAIHTNVFGDAYRELLARARIVFNYGIRGECNRRVFETTAAGALLFQEAHNRETRAYFQDRQECVYYTADNLESLLENYLQHEDERQAIAAAAHRKAQSFGIATLWEEQIKRIDDDWPTIVERLQRRPQLGGDDQLFNRTWQALCCGDAVEPALVTDLGNAVVASPTSAALHNALGLAIVRNSQGAGPITSVHAEQATGYFQRALDCAPHFLMAGLNAIETLVGLQQPKLAMELAQNMLRLLDRSAALDGLTLEAGHFPPSFDLFRVEWERAAWSHAGNPSGEFEAKRELLRWRLHLILAQLNSDMLHAYEAVAARPDLPSSRSTLGAELLRGRRPAEAVAHLRKATDINPFDLKSAAMLFQALGAAGDEDGQRRWARSRRLLAQAAPQVVPLEDWFQQAPPVGDELASIIVLCCNEVEFTRLCLDSVLALTRPPYELIVVDNGSTDATPSYLAELRGRPGPARVEIIRNETNRGFPAGCNQALAQARGRYVVFLNNDSVVTQGWLDGLIAWSLHDWPKVGLVGAVTNFASPPQQIAVDYADLAHMPAFAAMRRRQFAAKAMRFNRLSGFCLLARRDVLDQVGGFDEQFGIGFFDDDDLCVRVRQAGFQLLIALNVFVHHFGSRTFLHLGIDCRQQLAANFARFQGKWGPEHSAGYRLPEPMLDAPPAVAMPTAVDAADGVAPSVPASVKRQRISMCMIVKDEEHNLPACLESVADLVDEIIVADTGSTDRTRDIAAKFGARVVEFPWVDSFAAARNESLRHATGDWIFWLDADDRLDQDNRPKARKLFSELTDENVAFVMKCLCLPDEQRDNATIVDHIRLFRNHADHRWQFRVHEQILPAIRRRRGKVRWSDVVIQHVGYRNRALRLRKLERDLRLLQLENAESPDHPFTLFNLGSVLQELGRLSDAVPLLRRSLERSHPQDSIVRKVYALLVQCQRQLGHSAAAVEICAEGRRHYPEDGELSFQEGLARKETGDYAGAEACWLRLLTQGERDHFASVEVGLSSYKTRHNLAAMYLEAKRYAEAEAQWQRALAEEPRFLPAWVGMAELHFMRGQWPELTRVAQRLEDEFHAPAEADVLRARGHLARKEYASARHLAEQAIARAPEMLLARRVLSHAYLQEGKDMAAAEQALREVLRLSPNDKEANNNLAVLMRQRKG